MAKVKKPGQKNRVVHRPQLGTFTADQSTQPVEVQEEYGYEVEVEASGAQPVKMQPEAKMANFKAPAETTHTSPKALLKPVIIMASAIGIMLGIKLIINLVS